MFESAASYVLNRFLGKYVQNLDSSNLNVSIFKGDVELTDLQLKPEALVELKLPVEVKAGYVGKIKVDIPWTSLFSASVVVNIEDVYLLAGPVTDRMYDPDRERALQNAIKRETLEALEASSNKADPDEKDDGFLEKLYTYVVNNIQISIGRVHLRYEDTVTNPDHPFACGIMLKHVSAYTTDGKWQPAQMDNAATVIHKLLEMRELSVYWNPYIPEQHLIRSRINTDGWRNLLKQSILKHSIFEEDFDFIIEPVSAETKVIISKDNNHAIPKFFADISLDEIEILLSRQQFLNILTLKDSFQLMSVNQKYRKYHPNVLLKISPRSWWMYAYTAVVEERIRPYSWERIREHRSKYRKYRDLYRKSLELPNHESIKAKLWELEESLDVCNIVIAREEAKSEFAPEKIVKKEKEKKGWFSSWFSSDSEEEEVDIHLNDESKDWLSKLTPEEKKSLYQGIGYDENANVTKLPKEYVEYKVQVNLRSCCLSLVNYSKKILQISVTQMLGSWETRPAGDAYRLSCHTEAFTVEGASIEHELVPIVTSDVNVYAPSVNQVFTLDFESNPLYVDADFSLKTNIQPVEVVYDEHSICEVRAFFQLPSGTIDVKNAAMETMQEVVRISQAGLIYAINKHKTIHLAVNMKSPYVVIPEFGTLHRGGNVLIADLGMLQIKSELQPKDSSLEHGNLSESEIASRLYDQFNITITDVKVLLADSGDDWHTAQIQPTSEYHILPSMKLILDFYNSVKPDYKQLPQQKIITTLPSFEINISDKKLLLLWKFFRNFPLPSSTSVGMLGEDTVDAGLTASFTIEERLKHHIAPDPNEIQLEPDLKSLKVLKQRVLGRNVIITSNKYPKSPPVVVMDNVDKADIGDDTENWTTYEDLKAVDDISSRFNTTNIVFRVVIREVMLQLSKSLDKVENPYLMFRAERLRLDAVVTEHGLAAHASLGAVQLADKIHVGTSGEYMELMSTKPGTDLVSVLYRKVERNCPDFDSVYHSVEQSLRLQFETLNILADQGAIMYLKTYIDGIQSSVHSLDMVTSVSTAVSSLITDPTKSISRQKSQPADEPDQLSDDEKSVVKWNIMFDLHDLSLVMSDNNSKIAEIHVRELKGHMLDRYDRLALIGSLRDIDVKDCNHGALYPNILMLEDKEDSLFKFSFSKYNRKLIPLSDNRQIIQPFDYTFNLRVGHLQLVALGKFYWEITKFLEPLLSAEVLDTASVSMKAVTKQMDTFQQDNRRFGITVDMMTPTILIPVKSDSLDLLLLKSGDLHVENVFDVTDVGHGLKQEWNHIYVSLTFVQLSRARLSPDDDAFLVHSCILEPMTFQTDVRLALEPEVSDVHMDIACKLDKINSCMSQKDCQVLFGVLKANWAEGAPLCDIEPIRRAPILSQTSQESGTVIVDPTMSSSMSSKKSSSVVLFTMEGMELILNQDSKNGGTVDFAKLIMGKITGTVNSREDGEMKVTVALETLYIINIKPDSTHFVKKILYYDKESAEKDADSRRPLVSVIYKVSGDGNQKADIMMEKVIMNVQIPYIMEMSDFFTEAFTSSASVATPPGGTAYNTLTPPGENDEGPVMTLYFSISQPEIVLLADPESQNSRTIVVNADFAFEYVANPTQQKMWSKISTVRMFSSMYDAPSNHQSKMISPCDIEFNRCFDIAKNELSMSAKVAKLYIHLTPPNIRLLMDVLEILQQKSLQSPEASAGDLTTNTTHDLWKIKQVTSEKWIEKWKEDPATGPVFGPLDPPTETFYLDVQEVCAFFEVDNLDQSVPLLCISTSVDSKILNWTKHMRLTADLELEVCYYNEKLSVWEPLVEPNLVQEGSYERWALKMQMFEAQSFPIVCNYDDNGLDVPDGLQADVEQIISKNHFRSSSSENEADEELDSPNEMTILRPKPSRRKVRIASDKSYDSLSRHSSVQGESDSESESLIHTITNKLGSIFTTDSSEDADVSETDDNDESLDWTLDKPIFLTPQGPVKFRTGPERFDEIDGGLAEVIEPDIGTDEDSLCSYIIFSSPDKLMINVTQPAMKIIGDILKSVDKSAEDELTSTSKLPALAIYNKLGAEVDVILHKSVKIHADYVHDCHICHPGDMRHATPTSDEINVITEEDEEEDEDDVASLSSQRRPLTFVNQTLADAGHTLISAGAFVFDDDVMSGAQLDRDGIQIQIATFDTSAVQMMNRACRKLIHITPKQLDELENEHSTKYYMVYDVDMNHSHKTVTLQSPLQLRNNLTMPVDVLVLREELQTYRRNAKIIPEEDDFMKLTTLAPQELFAIPLFAAYHCALYICPSELPYKRTSSPIWWPDLVQIKDRQKYFTCKSLHDEKLFNIKVVCQEGETLRPTQMLTRTIPYFTITLHPPVVLHNYLPYDLQFSLQGSEGSSSLTHGDSTPLYTVNMTQAYKLNLYVADYLTCDWSGTLDITQEMEEFKAISMDTDLDPDNNNKHLSLSVHCSHDKSWNLYIYSPYWIVNKTDLPFQIRGSMSDVALDCQPYSYPQLFRYKKNKRKKAKLKVYESHWSHAFSLDTVGNSGVVECVDNQRNCKYMFMVQSQLSKLKLTKIITVLPFFLVVNSSSKPLRYMEENKSTDLWFDLAVGQCSPFWPVTESYTMFVKYEKSNVVSQHFPFRGLHNTVLRMENGSALCVSVTGGTQNPITVQFTDYDVGDAPVRVENFCDDVFIKIHQKNQSQTTILSSNQSVLCTWDDPTSERTLMWNIYGRNQPNFPAAISKDGYGHVNLKMKSLKSSGTVDYVDAPDIQTDSSPEDDSDEVDGLIGKMDESLLGKTRSDKVVIFWVSYLDHQQRVLLFTQDERVAKGARRAHVQGIDIPHERGVIQMNEVEQATKVVFMSLDGICVSMMNQAYEEVALLSLTSPPATWEVEVNSRWKMLNVELQTWLEDQYKNRQSHASLQQQFEADLNKMQMLKPYMGALRRRYNPGIWFNYRASEHHMSFHAKVQKVQLDNQLPDAYFPTVLHPCPTPVYIVRKKGQKPFIEMGMMRRTVPENNVDTVRYMKFLVQEFNIKIDKGFMMSLYDVFASLLTEDETESSKVQSDLILTQKSLQDVASVLIQNRQRKIFFEYLRLSPLKMHVSFSLNGIAHLSQENKPSLVSDIVDFFLGSVGATFTEMKDVELKMAYFEVKGMSLSWQQLTRQIQAHYTHQAIQQAYVLIFGLDVLGNPYGLIKDFTQGFGDLFYEPFLDSVQGSDEFADSLVRGVHSMLGNTVGGAAGSVARITGSLGSALAAMSLDKNYKMKRRATMQQRPVNLPLSLALAGRGFVMGVCLGLSGVVLDPIRGAQEEGVEGFFKGVGKGIMGLLTKPAGGVFDMVSMAFDGLQRAAELENGVVHRMRKPRFINPYLGLRPFSKYQAVGANLLLNVNKGQFAKSDMYWAHAPLSPADRADVLLITTRNIILLQKHRCWGGWDIEWEVKVEHILGFPAIVNKKLVFKVKPDESSVNIFTGGEQEISCDDIEMLRWIQQRIENLMKYKQR